MTIVRNSLLGLLFASPLLATPSILSDIDLVRIERLIYESPSPVVRRALKQEREFRVATGSEVFTMLRTASSLPRSGRADEAIKQAVLARMTSDLTYIASLNVKLASLSPDKDEVTWSCKTNKLVEILTEAIPFFEKHAEELLEGRLPSQFIGYWDSPRCLGPCENRAPGHNSRELALKASLLLTILELEGIPHVEDKTVDLLNSAVVHTTQLPKGKVFQDIQKLSFFYNGTRSPVEGELAFVHGGYAFGGQFSDSHFQELGGFGKRFGPQDCASGVSKMIGRHNVMWTADYVSYHREYLKIAGLLVKHTGTPPQLVAFEPNDIYEVLPGMVRVSRRFDLATDPHMNATLGTSGHAQLVIAVEPTTRTLVTVEYNRDLPVREGFGVARVPFDVAANTKQFFFTVNDK